MTTKRTNLLGATLLGGALLLGTAGLALAQDPTASSAPTPMGGTPDGMMGGQDMNAGQMRGMAAMHAGMTNGQGMNAGQVRGMAAMHAGMMNGR